MLHDFEVFLINSVIDKNHITSLFKNKCINVEIIYTVGGAKILTLGFLVTFFYDFGKRMSEQTF